jgi:transcription antitermination factor NusG
MVAADQWFVVQTNPQRETFVDEQLSALDPYLPRFKTAKGRIAPLFPRYLFVPAMVHWSPICNTVGVRALLMSGEHPAIIPGKVITDWRSRERGGLVQLPPPPRLKPGERLIITRGSLRYHTVIYAGMSGKDRERVLIEMLGHNVTLIVPTADLAPEFRSPARNGLRRRRETLNGPGGRYFS